MADSSNAKATIAKRQKLEKEKLIEQLKKTPIIQIAAEKAGVARATYYRWARDDPAFAEAAKDALHHGRDLVNDMAESQLLAAIRERNIPSIFFWLKHRHPSYTTRVEVNAKLNDKGALSPEQASVVVSVLGKNFLSSNDLSTIEIYGQSQQPATNDAGSDQQGDLGSENPHDDHAE
jgi:hypothetical protein